MNLTLMMRAFTVRTRMLATAALVALALLVVGGVGVASQLYSRAASKSFIDHEFTAVTQIATLRTTMSALRGIEKDMLLRYGKADKVAALHNTWTATFSQIEAGAAELAGMLTLPEQKEKVAEAITRLGSFKTGFEPVIKQLEAQGFDSPAAAITFMAIAQVDYDEAQNIVVALAADIERAAADGGARLEKVGHVIVIVLIGTIVLTLLVILPLTLLNMLSIVKPFREAEALARRIEAGDLSHSDVDVRGRDEAAHLLGALQRMQASLSSMVGQVRSSTYSIKIASSEIANGSLDLSVRTEETASSLQAAASSMDQLTGTVRQSADSARQANQLATSAAEVAARGGSVVSQVVKTMDEINQSSKKISDIIGVIDGIAFQTNILALNAAVEAARAGEQGRGFAVVAAEVRSLAQRSAQAAKEIKGLIGASVDRVEVGSRLVADAGKTMSEIVGSVQRVTDIIGEITAASTEQSEGIGNVSGAVTQLDHMTQQNAALVEQSAAAAESLKEQAQRLAQAVSIFKLDDGSADDVTPAAPVALASSALKPVAMVTPRPLAAVIKPALKPAARATPVKLAPARAATPVVVPPVMADTRPVLRTAPTPAAPATVSAPRPSADSKLPAAASASDDSDWESF